MDMIYPHIVPNQLGFGMIVNIKGNRVIGIKFTILLKRAI